jgi:hypothetical protein
MLQTVGKYILEPILIAINNKLYYKNNNLTEQNLKVIKVVIR